MSGLAKNSQRFASAQSRTAVSGPAVLQRASIAVLRSRNPPSSSCVHRRPGCLYSLSAAKPGKQPFRIVAGVGWFSLLLLPCVGAAGCLSRHAAVRALAFFLDGSIGFPVKTNRVGSRKALSTQRCPPWPRRLCSAPYTAKKKRNRKRECSVNTRHRMHSSQLHTRNLLFPRKSTLCMSIKSLCTAWQG